MPLMATPMTIDTPRLDHTPRTRSPAASAAAHVTIAMSTDIPTRRRLYCTVPCMLTEAIPKESMAGIRVPPMATDATSSHRELIDLKLHHRAAPTETFAPTPDSARA